MKHGWAREPGGSMEIEHGELTEHEFKRFVY
jgi:hypothetical protein